MNKICQYHILLGSVLQENYNWSYCATLDLVNTERSIKHCSICLTEFNGTFAYVPPCNHVFHIECILPNILDFTSSKCPDCGCNFEFYHKNNNVMPIKSYDKENTCDICQKNLKFSFATKTSCGHIFHSKCLNESYSKTLSCNCPVPYCNRLLFKNLCKNNKPIKILPTPSAPEYGPHFENKNLPAIIPGNVITDAKDKIFYPTNFDTLSEAIISNSLCVGCFFDPTHTDINKRLEIIINKMVAKFSSQVKFIMANVAKIDDKRVTEEIIECPTIVLFKDTDDFVKFSGYTSGLEMELERSLERMVKFYSFKKTEDVNTSETYYDWSGM